MRGAGLFLLVSGSLLLLVVNTNGQGGADACGETAGSTWSSTPAVYGRINLQGFEGTKFPKITVSLYDRNGGQHRYTVDRNGFYCFHGIDGGGGTVVVDVEGNEVGRRSLGASTLHLRQHREDFDLFAANPSAKPSTISAKFVYERDAANTALLARATEAEQSKDLKAAALLFREMLSNDPRDYIVWSRLGSVYFETNDLKAAEKAYVESIRFKPDFSYAVMSMGRIYLAWNDIQNAIKFLEKATQLEPNAPRGFQLLGEAYLLAKKGTLGVEALNEAIRLDPIGMADSHLLMAALYDRAGAKSWASREYKLFLAKKPEHPDRKKFEKYIKDNPPEPS